MKSANDMKKTDSEITLPLPENFVAVNQRVQTLGDAVEKVLSNYPRPVAEKPPSLEDIRREALKTKLELDGLRETYENTLGLEMVEEDERKHLEAVAELRFTVAELFCAYKKRAEEIQELLKAVKAKLAPNVVDDLINLQNLIKAEGAEIQDLINSIPELGMTMAEWNLLDKDQRRALRLPGRSKPPLEAMIKRTERHLLDLVAEANVLSSGKIRTIEQAIRGVELSKRGRPQVSAVGKMERKLENLKKKLKVTASTPSKMQDLKIARLQSSIEDIQLEIEAYDAALVGVDVDKRQLEKLRAKHRDLVVAEVASSGQEQASLLMEILRNETAQLDVIDRIRDVEPDARITVTTKVNPSQTMDRIKRLRSNGQLKDAELEEVNKMEQAITNYKFSRNRY